MIGTLWVVRVGGNDRELRPWHYMCEGRRGRWGTPTMCVSVSVNLKEPQKIPPCIAHCAGQRDPLESRPGVVFGGGAHLNPEL